MMIIRSITFFINIGANGDLLQSDLKKIQLLQTELKAAFADHGDQVQSVRLATNTFCEFLPFGNPQESIEMSCEMAEKAKKFGIDYLSLGPALPKYPESYSLIPQILKETNSIFMTGVMADPICGIDLQAVRSCAEIIVQLGKIEANGFGNLFFAALANVPGGIPFLPSAYQDREGMGFALAVEAADLAIEGFGKAKSLKEAKLLYIKGIEDASGSLHQIINSILEKEIYSDISFYGFDLTPAPYITAERSVGTALELLGGMEFGLHGSLAASAFLMDALDSAEFQRSGFNGLMLPVLEDAILARNVAEGNLSLKDLLLMSAVCGTGLDTIPLSGYVTIDQIYAVLVDVASLSARLRKPLTARLMPIPGKQAGEMTSFDFSFFINSRVMNLESKGLSGLFRSSEQYQLHPKRGS